MKTLVRISNALASKALGSVDAGACDAWRGCCCNSAHTYGLNCYANCVKMSCTVKYSAYHQLCYGGA
jgi:hypothetical protein